MTKQYDGGWAAIPTDPGEMALEIERLRYSVDAGHDSIEFTQDLLREAVADKEALRANLTTAEAAILDLAADARAQRERAEKAEADAEQRIHALWKRLDAALTEMIWAANALEGTADRKTVANTLMAHVEADEKLAHPAALRQADDGAQGGGE